MKKLFAALLAASLLCLCACGGPGEPAASPDPTPEPAVTTDNDLPPAQPTEDPVPDETGEGEEAAPAEEGQPEEDTPAETPAAPEEEAPEQEPAQAEPAPEQTPSAEPESEPQPEPEPEQQEAPVDKKTVAQSLIGRPVSELYAAIGKPNSSDYAPSCLVEGAEDGELFYDGFTVYTEKGADYENVYDVL